MGIIVEPNGNSPILKLIEKVSKYHRDHDEKSYGFNKLKIWIEEAGGKVIYHKRVGCVPCFSPDIVAKILKFIEPVLENIPVLNIIFCAIDVIVYEKEQ